MKFFLCVPHFQAIPHYDSTRHQEHTRKFFGGGDTTSEKSKKIGELQGNYYKKNTEENNENLKTSDNSLALSLSQTRISVLQKLNAGIPGTYAGIYFGGGGQNLRNSRYKVALFL